MSAIVPKPAPYNSRLTVGDLRTNLAYLVCPNDPDDPKFLRVANQASERLINSGKWKGLYSEITFYYQDHGYIWLPNEYQSIIGMRYKRVPFPTFTQSYQYCENGPGEVDDTLDFPYLLVDMGDGHPVQYDANDLMDITTLASWRVYCSSTDNGKKVRVFGKTTISSSVTPYDELCDASGNPGIQVTLTAPYTTVTIPSGSANPTVITGFQKPVSVDNMYLKCVDTDGEIYTCGMYEPRDTRPMFRRYKTGTMDNSETDDAIKVICQRRFLPMVCDTDWVLPGNMAAMKHAIRCIMYEDATDEENAVIAWNKALDFLNQESRISRGAGRPLVAFNIFGDGQAIPTAN